MFKRNLNLDICNRHSCFLWGPRQTGKSTLLHTQFPEAIGFDLLLSDEYRRCLQNPSVIRQELQQRKLTGANQGYPIIIDEIQKVPEFSWS